MMTGMATFAGQRVLGPARCAELLPSAREDPFGRRECSSKNVQGRLKRIAEMNLRCMFAVHLNHFSPLVRNGNQVGAKRTPRPRCSRALRVQHGFYGVGIMYLPLKRSALKY